MALEAETNLTDFNATFSNLYVKGQWLEMFLDKKNNSKKSKRSLICFEKRRLHLFSVVL
jgi:hypothetical protein